MIDVYIGIRIESAENLSEITSILNIEPTMQHENGDLIGYDVKSKCNSWTLKRQLVKNGTTIMTVKNFFEQYSSILENKNKLIKNGSMRIRLSLISLYGQLNYTLAPEDIAFLNDLHIPLEISVFSYGGCDP